MSESYVLRRMGLWRLPRIKTGDNVLCILENVVPNENNSFNIITDEGVIRNVDSENILGTYITLPMMVDLSGRRLDFQTNIELHTDKIRPWSELGFNQDAINRLHEMKNRIRLLSKEKTNLLNDTLNPMHGEFYRDRKIAEAEWLARMRDQKVKVPTMHYGGYQPDEEYEL